ncbi:MAG: 5'/3'-nucleotidase SurE [Prevotellaceae bacterium]|jgi:5'-nucleotidase|nr:5'/3'-nucleotidase SurE [Prevotellaceae bacterium]
MAQKRPLILLTNDDSVNASGLRAAIQILAPFGDLFVIAPDVPRSGTSHALTVTTPITADKVEETDGIKIYSCTGTPTDCVKLAMSCLLPRQPDLMVSGINHGSNSSVSVIYSGTMGAAIEAAMLGMPAIGFSLCDHSLNADFSGAVKYGATIVQDVLANGIPKGIALNVNIPALPFDEIKGIQICRQNKGMWNEDFILKPDPVTGEKLYWLTGYYHNEEAGAEGTDETALSNGYVSIVPTHFDLTAYDVINEMKRLERL